MRCAANSRQNKVLFVRLPTRGAGLFARDAVSPAHSVLVNLIDDLASSVKHIISTFEVPCICDDFQSTR